MCQSREQGGRRCDNELNGTRAIVKITEKVLDIPEKNAKVIWKEEYSQAKQDGITNKEEADTQEVTEFILEQEYQLRGTSLSEHDKKIIGNNLQKAKKEQLPTKRAFTAWKKIMKRVWKKQAVSAIALLSASTLALTACSTDEDKTSPTPTSPVTNTTQPTQTSEPTPTTSDTPVDINSINIPTLPGKSPLNERGYSLTEETYSNDSGTWRKWTADPDAPVRDLYSHENISVGVEDSKKEEAQEAWGTALDFITHEFIDSEVAGDISPELYNEGGEEFSNKLETETDEWLENPGPTYVIDEVIDIHKGVDDAVPSYLDNSSDIGYYTYEDGGPRIIDFDAQVKAVNELDNPEATSFQFWVDFSYTRETISPKNGQKYYYTTNASTLLAFNDSDKEPSANKWKLSGYEVNYEDSEVLPAE